MSMGSFRLTSTLFLSDLISFAPSVAGKYNDDL
jgi:hypothetical protein